MEDKAKGIGCVYGTQVSQYHGDKDDLNDKGKVEIGGIGKISFGTKASQYQGDKKVSNEEGTLKGGMIGERLLGRDNLITS